MITKHELIDDIHNITSKIECMNEVETDKYNRNVLQNVNVQLSEIKQTLMTLN